MVLTVYTGLSFSPTRLISGFYLKVFIYFFKYCVFLEGFCRINRSQEQSDLEDQASRLGSEQQGAPGCSRDVPVCWRTSESHWYHRRTWLGRHVSIRSSTINKLIFLFFPLGYVWRRLSPVTITFTRFIARNSNSQQFYCLLPCFTARG